MRCIAGWFFHKWSKWSEPFQTQVVYRQTVGDFKEYAAIAFVQKRSCERCGALDYRKVPLR